MKKAFLLSAAVLCLSIASLGQSLTKAERDRAANYLQQTRDGVLAATKGLSEAQMKFKAAPDRCFDLGLPCTPRTVSKVACELQVSVEGRGSGRKRPLFQWVNAGKCPRKQLTASTAS